MERAKSDTRKSSALARSSVDGGTPGECTPYGRLTEAAERITTSVSGSVASSADRVERARTVECGAEQSAAAFELEGRVGSQIHGPSSIETAYLSLEKRAPRRISENSSSIRKPFALRCCMLTR